VPRSLRENAHTHRHIRLPELPASTPPAVARCLPILAAPRATWRALPALRPSWRVFAALRAPWRALAACALLGAAQAAAAQVPDNTQLAAALNTRRAQGCPGHPGTARPLQLSSALSRVARLAAGGADLSDALREAGYRAEMSALVALQGPRRAEDIAALVAQRQCSHLVRPAFSETGIHHAGQRTWIVMAAPFTPPSPDDTQAVAETVLRLVNEARAQPRRCGNQAMAAAGPVRLNATLTVASLGHARDMARHGYLDHTARDGSQPGARATRAGYRWRAVGENIASGQSTPQQAVQGWLHSAGHCVNLMQPHYTEMGLAFAVNRTAEGGIYWVQMFGQPR
jgi:uncharacterized protein YkwD